MFTSELDLFGRQNVTCQDNQEQVLIVILVPLSFKCGYDTTIGSILAETGVLSSSWTNLVGSS